MTMIRDLKIEGMTCLSCAHHLEEALKGVAGVERVRVDYPAGSGTVQLSSRIADAVLLRAVESAGYRARMTNGGGVATIAETHSCCGNESADEADGAEDFDLLVIGTGGAGMAAAIRGTELGARVGIVEAGTIGGTCVNVGCIPSKNLIAAAHRYHTARTGFPGIDPTEPRVDWRHVIRQKAQLVEDLRKAKYVDVLESYPEITLLQGEAKLLGGRRVAVGGTPYLARKIVIAAGAAPWLPPIPGLDQIDALNSTTVMELEELPRSMIVLGGGYVGLELGQTIARFGARVTLLKRGAWIASEEDPEIAAGLRSALEEEGMEIHTGIRYLRVEKEGEEVVVHVEQDGQERAFRAERILVATGRRANTRHMGLEESGIRLDPKGFVRVDASLRTADPDVYAAGDVAGGPGFVYTAARDGRIAAENALTGSHREVDLRAIPRVTFTDPQIAAVGLTEAEASAAGLDFEVRRLGLENVPRALVEHDTRGFIKVVAEAGTGRILGVHVLAPHAGELMGEATLAVRLGLTVQDLVDTLHPYLTWGEGLKLTAQTFTKDVAKLSCCA
jgi:mercuric reductase